MKNAGAARKKCGVCSFVWQSISALIDISLTKVKYNALVFINIRREGEKGEAGRTEPTICLKRTA